MSGAIQTLNDNFQALSQRDRKFAESLLSQHDWKGYLWVEQSKWVLILAERATNPQPAEQPKTTVGDFAGVIQLFKKAQYVAWRVVSPASRFLPASIAAC